VRFLGLLLCSWIKQSFGSGVWRKLKRRRRNGNEPHFFGWSDAAWRWMIPVNRSRDMTPRTLAAVALALAVASPALAQGGPMSVGLPSDPKDISMHCAAAVATELFLAEEEGKATRFDKARLGEAMMAWMDDAGAKHGKTFDEMIDDPVFLALAENKGGNDTVRMHQVRWCLERTPKV
jgi:hypothetical protein